MNNKNISNPIYQKLFPDTYAKNARIQSIIASIKSKAEMNAKFLTPENPNIEIVEITQSLDSAG